jgi:hypothetical protein
MGKTFLRHTYVHDGDATIYPNQSPQRLLDGTIIRRAFPVRADALRLLRYTAVSFSDPIRTAMRRLFAESA